MDASIITLFSVDDNGEGLLVPALFDADVITPAFLGESDIWNEYVITRSLWIEFTSQRSVRVLMIYTMSAVK